MYLYIYNIYMYVYIYICMYVCICIHIVVLSILTLVFFSLIHNVFSFYDAVGRKMTTEKGIILS